MQIRSTWLAPKKKLNMVSEWAYPQGIIASMWIVSEYACRRACYRWKNRVSRRNSCLECFIKQTAPMEFRPQNSVSGMSPNGCPPRKFYPRMLAQEILPTLAYTYIYGKRWQDESKGKNIPRSKKLSGTRQLLFMQQARTTRAWCSISVILNCNIESQSLIAGLQLRA